MATQDFEVKISIDLEMDGAAQSAVRQTLDQLRQSTTGLDGEINKVQRSMNGTAKSQRQLNGELSTTRYALYDVASTLTGTGVALLGLSVAATAVAISWEKDFAQVVRTTGVTGDAIVKLRTDLVGLAQTMPVAFGDIAQIATLAGQLGVAEENVASFTETVAKFSAVTDLTVDQAATAFGRLDSLLPDVRGNYEALGSSIAKVGVNSVATESQIVNISTQISSMGAFAGLTAAEVVGLSGALASVGAAPEISRGTVTRVFTQMSKAIAVGGEELESFANIAGVSADEFASAFGTNRFGPIFKSFITGLNDTSKTGGDATAALRDLGITSVRDVPLLLRLAGAGNVLGQSLKDARDGFADGNELNRQYGIISETTAARLQILVQNFQALLAAIGGANLGPLSDFIDFLSELLKGLTAFASTDVGGTVLGLVSILGGLLGVLAIGAGAMALFGASSIGMQQALIGLTTTAPRASAAILGSGTAAAVAAGQMNTATASAKLLGKALKALSIVGLALIIPDLSEGFQKMLNQFTGASTDIDDRINGIKSGLDGLGDTSGFDEFSANLARGMADIGLPATELNRKIKEVDDQLAEMASSDAAGAQERIDGLRRSFAEAGISGNEFNILFRETIAKLKEAPAATEAAIDPMQELADAEAKAAEEAEVFAASLGLTAEAVTAMNENLQSGSQAFFDMAKAIEDATEDGKLSIQDFITNLEEQVAAQQGFADNLGLLAARGASAFVSELSKMGPEGAAVAAQAVDLSDAELAHLEELARTRANNSGLAWAEGFTSSIPVLQTAYQFGGDSAVKSMQDALAKGDAAVLGELKKMARTAAANPIPISADNGAALNTLNALMREINSRTGTVTIYAQYSDGALQTIRDPRTYKNYATGGEIVGPGTGTSDSIVARVSNGEFIMRASAVNQYGLGFMHALNSGRMPRFANGGSVGSSSSSSSQSGGFSTGIMELGPKSIKAISREVSVSVLLDDVSISRASQRGDRKRRMSGDL